MALLPQTRFVIDFIEREPVKESPVIFNSLRIRKLNDYEKMHMLEAIQDACAQTIESILKAVRVRMVSLHIVVDDEGTTATAVVAVSSQIMKEARRRARQEDDVVNAGLILIERLSEHVSQGTMFTVDPYRRRSRRD